MIFGYLDSSSLVKRYVAEPGSPVVDHLFARLPLGRLVVLSVGLAEVVSILVRKHNGKRITTPTFRRALAEFQKEFKIRSPVQVIDVTAVAAVRAYRFIRLYSVNSTDAILLRSAIDLAILLRAAGDDLLLVSSDLRLINAARAESLTVFNPETGSVTDLDALLGP